MTEESLADIDHLDLCAMFSGVIAYQVVALTCLFWKQLLYLA